MVILSTQAYGQALLSKVSHQVNKDGSVIILAENLGVVPITVHLRATLTNMSSSVPLPAKLVVFPGKSPRIIATFSPVKQWGNRYYYNADEHLGICSGHKPDTIYRYGLPFRQPVTYKLGLGRRQNTSAADSSNLFFDLPANTPVLAAREGIVAQIKEDIAKNTRNPGQSNYIIVFHDDGSYAWYQFLRKSSATVAIGQRVAKGELLAYSTDQKRLLPLWFAVLYPTDYGPKEVNLILE